jgi:hypothetical protein
LASRETGRIVIRREIADERSRTVMLLQQRQRLLKKSGLSSARA